MFDWIKNINREYPEFWKNYLSLFETKSSRFVVLNTETTGLNPKKDVIISFGAIGVKNDIINIGDSFELIIPQYKYLHDNDLSNEFIIESNLPKFAEPNAVEELIKFIGNATLVGHRIHFDIEMINKSLEKLECGRLRNEALDLEIMFKKWKEFSDDKKFSIAEIAQALKLPEYDLASTIEEAYTMGLCFLKLKKHLGIE
jgi:DNA polymerase-3 subunit epsilon